MKVLKAYSPVILCLILILSSKTLISQNPTYSKHEYWWAVFHPIAAMKIKSIARQCEVIRTNSKQDGRLDNFLNGGKSDAYRHVFYMAAFAQKVKPKKVKKLGIAHEKNNYHQFLKAESEFAEIPDSLTCVMDLENNKRGIEIGKANKKLSLIELSELVINEIQLGHAFIIKRDKAGNFLTCDEKIIEIKTYSKKWFIPKCLVASNYVFNSSLN